MKNITIEPPYNNDTTEQELRISLSELSIKARDINNSLKMYDFIKGSHFGKYLFGKDESGDTYEYCSLTLDSSTSSIKIYEEGIHGAEIFNQREFKEDYVTDEYVKAITDIFIAINELQYNTSEKFKYTKGYLPFHFEPKLEGSTLIISTEMSPEVKKAKRHELMGILLDIDDIGQRLNELERGKSISTDFFQKD